MAEFNNNGHNWDPKRFRHEVALALEEYRDDPHDVDKAIEILYNIPVQQRSKHHHPVSAASVAAASERDGAGPSVAETSSRRPSDSNTIVSAATIIRPPGHVQPKGTLNR